MSKELRISSRQVFEWLQEKNYQTDHGEQEYTMYFGVDMPKILNEFIEDHISALDHERDKKIQELEIQLSGKTFFDEKEAMQAKIDELKERNNFLEIQHSTSQSAREKVLEELAEHDRKEIEGLKQKLQESERVLLKLKNICEEHIEEFNIPELN